MNLGYPEGATHRPTNYPYGSASEVGSDAPMRMGGDVLWGLAGGTLLIGDVVYLSAVDTWNKSVTVANYAGLVGVVIGGTKTFEETVQTDAQIGTMVAANVNEKVIVMVYGICKVLSDAALATVNTKVTAGATTAGRVGTVGAASGNYVGGTLDTAAAAGSVIRICVGMVG